jgi:laccase
MTVVAADGEYLKPFNTTMVVISPGQTVDVLVTANQRVGKY